MRTTLDIDKDLMQRLRDESHRTQRSLKETVNAALRRALEGAGTAGKGKRFRCPAYAMGQPVSEALDLDKALALADALRDAETARKLELRK